MISFIRFYVIGISATIYYYFVAFIKLAYLPRHEAVSWTANNWGGFMLKHSGVKLKLHGEEHLKKLPTLFVFNHQSMLDLFVVCYLAPEKTLGVVKQSFRYIPFLGWFMRVAGMIFIDRQNRENALEAMKRTKHLADGGWSIMMAPEGTRSHTGRLQRLKKGAFYLALQTKLPIVPVTIVNAYQLFPKHKWVPTPGTIDVYVDPPIDTSHWTEASIPQGIEQVRQIFLSHLHED